MNSTDCWALPDELHDDDVRCTLTEATCAAAAAAGRLDILKFLRHQNPPCPWSADTCTAAATHGHLAILHWLFSQTPPCPSNMSTMDCLMRQFALQDLQELSNTLERSGNCSKQFLARAAVRAVKLESADAFQWASAQSPSLVAQIVEFAAQKNPGIVRWLHASGCLDTDPAGSTRLQSATSAPAAMGNLAGLQELEAVLAAHEAFPQAILAAHAGRLTSSGYHAIWQNHIHIKGMEPGPNPDFLAVADWLMSHLSKDQQAHVWAELCQANRSLLAVEMKAQKPGRYAPQIMWSAATHSFAAAHVKLAALRWLLEQQGLAPEYTTVSVDCSNARMLLLVHGHAWKLPDQLAMRLAAAENRRLAFYGVVQQQQAASRTACLGRLPRDLIKVIACRADVDFSWSRS